MARIFICYRRENARGYAGRIYDHLRTLYPEADLFYDRESLKPGAPWPDYIRRQFGNCEFLLVVLQKNWHTIQDPDSGERRLSEPGDWVRLEIEAGLSQPSTTVIPVLVGDEPKLPLAKWLPPSIRGLLDGQSFTLDEQDFRGAVKKLADHMGGTSAQPAARAGPTEPPGKKSHEVCDRGLQKHAFRLALECRPKQGPLAFFLQGERLQSHENLVTSLEESVRLEGQHLIRPSGGSLVWECDTADAEPLLVRPPVFQRFDAAGTKELKDALERNRHYHFVSLHHTIVTSARRATTLAAVRSYLSWWDTVTLEPGLPVPLLFFSIIHDSSFLARLWWRWKMRALGKGGFQRVQLRYFETLENVNPGHVWEYFDKTRVGSLSEREQHLRRLFGKRKSLPMAEVEDYLAPLGRTS